MLGPGDTALGERDTRACPPGADPLAGPAVTVGEARARLGQGAWRCAWTPPRDPGVIRTRHPPKDPCGEHAEVLGGSGALGSCATHTTTVNLLQCGRVPGTVPDP